jgi:hypothetical protein
MMCVEVTVVPQCRGGLAPAASLIAGGNETVPTVVIDGRPMVNPAPRQVIAAVRPG